MTIHDIKEMIIEGEGFGVEFKRKASSPEKIAKTLSAFANTKGGVVLFGVDDDGTIVGVESEKSELDLIERAGSMYCDPPVDTQIEIVPINNRDVIVVTVEESEEKPHYHVNDGEDEERVFIRVKDNTVLASKEVIKVLRDENRDSPPLTVSIGENEKRLFAYLDSYERIHVQEYAELINVSHRRASRILTTLVRAGVLRIHTLEKSDYFTLASDDQVSGHSRTKQSRTPQRH